MNPYMVRYEDIIENARIDYTRTAMPELTLVEDNTNYESNDHKYISELLELPILGEDMLDLNIYSSNVLNYILNISPELGFYYDMSKLFDKMRMIENYKKKDKNCDLLEIELAYFKRNNKMDYHDLLKRRDQMKKRLAFIKANPNVTIYDIISKNDGVQKYIQRANILKKIESFDTQTKSFVSIFINNNNVSISYLENHMNVDRISVLKMIYQLSLKGIVIYDSEGDVVRLNK